MWSAAVFSAICGEMCIGAVRACEERCLVSGSRAQYVLLLCMYYYNYNKHNNYILNNNNRSFSHDS